MAAHVPSEILTIEEWAAMPEDDPGELVDGVLVEEEVPDLTHATVVAWLTGVIGAWIIPRRGFVFGSEAKFAVAPRRGRKPDLTVYLPGGPALPRRGVVRVPPNIAVEVISPTARDRRRDRSEKAADYVEVAAASAGVVDPVPGCDGLRLDLDALWAEVDRLADDAQ